MINWIYYPLYSEVDDHLLEIIRVFENHSNEIDSNLFNGASNLESDAVLAIVADDLEKIGYDVERSKKKEDKIRVPVLFGLNGKNELSFEVDAYSSKFKTVIEVEAGRAWANYQFLKDYYESCMMINVDYFVVAVKNIYRTSKDFDKVRTFFDAMYKSNRFESPLKGVLIIGY